MCHLSSTKRCCVVVCLVIVNRILSSIIFFFFFFNNTATTEIYTLSLHDALPIYRMDQIVRDTRMLRILPEQLLQQRVGLHRSEEHTSELQSRVDLVCRLLLEKKKLKHEHSRVKNYSRGDSAYMQHLSHDDQQWHC